MYFMSENDSPTQWAGFSISQKKRAKYTLSLNYASRIKDTIAQSLTEASSKIVKWLFCLI